MSGKQRAALSTPRKYFDVSSRTLQYPHDRKQIPMATLMQGYGPRGVDPNDDSRRKDLLTTKCRKTLRAEYHPVDELERWTREGALSRGMFRRKRKVCRDETVDRVVSLQRRVSGLIGCLGPFCLPCRAWLVARSFSSQQRRRFQHEECRIRAAGYCNFFVFVMAVACANSRNQKRLIERTEFWICS